MAGLAQDGKIISVRLAIFAEMVKGKPWTPATLREVGGTEGVGVTFLEETFSSSTATPEHRCTRRRRKAVLKALLPDTGTDIKGRMRSETELRDASGYAGRPRDFDDVIGILDGELRLITPTDPEGFAGEAPSVGPAGERFYQLTHDYLVHPLREWLTRKQRETRRGRAELRPIGTRGDLELQARGPPVADAHGMGEHPLAHEPEGVDRAGTEDDEAGRDLQRAASARVCRGRRRARHRWFERLESTGGLAARRRPSGG